MCVICELKKMGISEDHILASNGMMLVLEGSTQVAAWLSAMANRTYLEQMRFKARMYVAATSTDPEVTHFLHIAGISRELCRAYMDYSSADYAEMAKELLTSMLMYATMYMKYCDPVDMLATAIEVADARAEGALGMMVN